MSGPKFTPGPWAVDPDTRPGMEWNNHIVRADKPAERLCFMANGLPDRGDEFEANASLIAAAPDMHKALAAAGHALRSYQFGNAATDLAKEIADACDEAIAKAEGRAS